ncbi:xylulokinase [Curtobacterium sp. PhB130]|nr:xylulokinase [Curtobacterium sp. PhB172]ROS76108.1 xylulokinase [Curtobacterium sp. PhB130]RPE76833.1 xylulokinase [Curtobacterium sp. PhB137]TCK64195.1 xylulokinase [Curtobacterium sp. PhB136]TCL78974.1 xylulokinase [Curtobacterium sp. PhB128]TCL97554.1 xylulokinase [Curtobacterium sp. PhB138]
MTLVKRAHRGPIVCGVDIGSTNTKVVGLGADSRVVSRAQRQTPRDDTDLSIDAQQLLRLIEDMLLEVCGTEFAVHAVCAVGVGEDGIPVDAQLRPTASALAWFDPRRARLFTAVAPQLAAADGVGVGDDAARTLVGWLWAREQGQLESAAGWVSLTDYAASAWSGTAFMSDSIAARTAAWDGRTRSWVLARVESTLRDPTLLPKVLTAGEAVGPILSRRLDAAGVLAPGALAIAGGHDHPIGGWAVDRLDQGAVLDSMGTAEVVVAQAPEQVNRTTGVDVAPGIRNTGTSLLSVEEFTRNVEWASLDPEVASELRLIASGRRKPDGYVDSDVFVAGDRGGGRPKYSVGAPAKATSRAAAVLGALARVGADAIDEVTALMPAPGHVYVAGGWSRAPGWLAIKEQVSGRRMQIVHEPEVAAVGAAMLAAAALDWVVDADTVMRADTSHESAR